MTNPPIVKDVAWYGTGRLGSQILHQVAATQKFNITLLVRRDPKSYKNLPINIERTKIDLEDQTTLVNALTGKDAVVVFTSMLPFDAMDDIQLALIKASIKAGVKFFIPSEWAPDTAGSNGATTLRIGPDTLPATPIIAMKRVVHNYLLARSGEGKIDFATLHTGNMLQNAAAFAAIDTQNRTACLPDGGDKPISVTSRSTLANGLVNLLASYPNNKNTFHYICDGETTMREVVDAVREATGPEKPWGITSYSVEERKKAADADLKEGRTGISQFLSVLGVPFVGGHTVWKNPDNEKLGLNKPSKEGAKRVVDDAVAIVLESTSKL